MSGSLAAGAKAGAAFGPWGSAAGAALGAAADIAGAAGGPQSNQVAFDARSWMDGSGWTVSTGSGRATGGDRRQEGAAFDAGHGGAGVFAGAPSQAGIGSFGAVLLGLVLLGLLWKAKTQ